MPVIKPDSSEVIKAFITNGGKVNVCKPSNKEGRSTYRLHSEMERNAMEGIGYVLNNSVDARFARAIPKPGSKQERQAAAYSKAIDSGLSVSDAIKAVAAVK